MQVFYEYCEGPHFKSVKATRNEKCCFSLQSEDYNKWYLLSAVSSEDIVKGLAFIMHYCINSLPGTAQELEVDFTKHEYLALIRTP